MCVTVLFFRILTDTGIAFKASIDRSQFGGVKITFGNSYFLDEAISGIPNVVPALFFDPFLLRIAFFELELDETMERKTQYSVPKRSFLSNLSPLKQFVMSAKSQCALLRAFELVGKFSYKAYARSELKRNKLAERAEKTGLNVEDILPNNPC